MKPKLILDEDLINIAENDYMEESRVLETLNLNIYKNFINSLINKKTIWGNPKHPFCQERLKSPKSGASGSIDVNLSKKIIKRSSYIVHKNMLSANIFQNFYMPRLINYCSDIKKYVNGVRKMFPNNFSKIYNCYYCIDTRNGPKKIMDLDLKISYEMDNASFGKDSSDNFHEDIINNKYDKTTMYSLLIQLYYISIVCNKKDLYHNDFKAANIVIRRSNKKFTYSGLGDVNIMIKKGDLIPVIIDYDLISFKVVDDDHPASGTSFDFSFFTLKMIPKVAFEFAEIFSLPDFNEPVDSDYLRYVFKTYM